MPLTDVPRMIMEEARRLLERQEADLDTLRTHTANLLTGASIVAAAFGAALSDSDGATSAWSAGFALVFFGLTVGAAIFIFWPRDWDFSQEIGAWVTNPPDFDADAVALSLAANFDSFREDNSKKLGKLQKANTVICVLLGLQVGSWGVALLA